MPRPAVSSTAAASPALWRLGAGAPPEGAFVALVPGVLAPIFALDLPPGLTGAARVAVARRQGIDRLGAGFDIRPARLLPGDGWTRILLAETAALAGWRAALGAAAPRCRALLPDYLALPAAPDLWSLSMQDGVVSARLGLADGFSAEPDLAARMLALALREARAAGQPPRAVLWPGDTEPSVLAALEGLALVTADQAARVLGHGEAALDLRHAAISAPDTLETRLRRWLLPALLVALGALGWAAAEALSARQDRAQAGAIRAEVLAAARRDLLGEGPILDLRAQVEREISRRATGVAGAGGDPLAVLRDAAPLLAQAEVQAVTLTPDGFDVALRLDDFRALDALVAALSGAGVGTRVLRSGIEGEGIGATLALTGDGP